MKRRPLQIAIVGMACRFPGAPDLSTYWANILANRDCTHEIPPDRWDASLFCEPQSGTPATITCRRGGYLDTPIPFDAAAHGIMPRTVEGGEPEQFLVLDAAHQAIDDAGLDPEAMKDQNVEVVIGRGNYFNRGNLLRLQHGRVLAQTVSLLASLHPEWTTEEIKELQTDLSSSLPPFEAATIPGQLTNATAGRLADRLNLSGASFVVDAASASSIVALDLACRALRDGRADLALVGGVYLEADVDFPLVFQKLGALSSTSTLRAFSTQADGTVSGEGVGVLVLQRLQDAERDQRRIYAVVQGIGVASDGQSRGLAAPSARGHARAMRRAYRSSGIDPATIASVEGHGLGLPAADRAELRALARVFPSPAVSFRTLGAVSSQIGHAMPAAGLAGLIKTALALHHRVLAPTRNADNPHPGVQQAQFHLLESSRPWIHGHEQFPRRAAVNAFGFSGINTHCILEEHTPSADGETSGACPHWDSEAVLVAAESRSALADHVRWLANRVRARHDVPLKDLAYTTAKLIEADKANFRIGFVVSAHEELLERLAQAEARLRDPGCAQIRDARGLYFWENPVGREGGLAFLFPGEGAQYHGMLADLCPHFPELRSQLDMADRIALNSGESVPPSQHLFGPGSSDTGTLWNTDTAVNAVLSTQWALYQILIRLGLRPNAVAGHSSGELPALAASGVIEAERDLEGALSQLAAVFRRLEADGAIPTARLVAIGAHRDRIQPLCDQYDDTVVIAIDNCPHQVVISGPSETVEDVLATARAQGILCEDLPFSRAYHTRAFEAVMAPLADFYAQLDFRSPRTPIYSCARASRMPTDPIQVRAIATSQWAEPVRFRETIEAMHADGLRVFVDVGARGNLAGYVDDTLRGKPAFAVAANLPRRSGTLQLNHLVASLFAQGIEIDSSYLHRRRRPRFVDLDAPPSPSRPTVPIHVGFPEMRLSPSVRECLVRPHPGTTRIANGQSPMATPRNGKQKTNGYAIPSGFEAAAAANPAPTPFDPPLSTHDPHQPHSTSNGSRSHERSLLDHLNTMDTFLDAQHRVMNAYFRTPGEPSTPIRKPKGKNGASPVSIPKTTSNSPSPTSLNPLPEAVNAGPWVGNIIDWIPGISLTSRYPMVREDDPVALHHTLGGRRVSTIDPDRKGLSVLPFAVMAEMASEVAALLAGPGLQLARLEESRALKWVPYEDDPTEIELRAHVDLLNPSKIRVSIFTVDQSSPTASRQVFETVAIFTSTREEPPRPNGLELQDARPSRFTAHRLYEEQWLFHGPPFQALSQVDHWSTEGISGRMTLLPLANLLRPASPGRFQFDPIALDVFTHLLGCWGLDYLEQGDVIFPLSMGSLSLYGPTPPIGTSIECRISIRSIEHFRVRVDADLILPDGHVWMAIRDWEDWRFHWPARYRDVFRAPDRILVGEPLRAPGLDTNTSCAVWLEPPADMGRPVWRDVLEQIQLDPVERHECRSLTNPELRRAHRLWGRMAAKEAVRRLWLANGGAPRYPADLRIEADTHGRPFLKDLANPYATNLPSLSIAHCDDVALAMAVLDPNRPVGVDVEPIVSRSPDFESIAFTLDERRLLNGFDPSLRDEWIARFWCAKEAAAKATGLGFQGLPSNVQIRHADPTVGTIHITLHGPLAHARTDLDPNSVLVQTSRRGRHAWAWTHGSPA